MASAIELTETNHAEVIAWLRHRGAVAFMRGGDGGGSRGGEVVVRTHGALWSMKPGDAVSDVHGVGIRPLALADLQTPPEWGE